MFELFDLLESLELLKSRESLESFESFESFESLESAESALDLALDSLDLLKSFAFDSPKFFAFATSFLVIVVCAKIRVISASCESVGMVLKDLGEVSSSIGAGTVIAGCISAFVFGYFALACLMKIIKKGKLEWFAAYLIPVGILGLIFLK